MRTSLTTVLSTLLALAATQPAAAHPGGHSQMSWIEFIQHVTQPDHLALLGLTVIVGFLAYRWGRRIEARARVAQRTRKDDRA